jgi:soluble lytic murein transglycosylase-like protein
MPPADLVALAKTAATRYRLNPALVCGVVEDESSWNPWEFRYEPNFRILYVARLELDPTAEIGRSCSWGLLQIMGQTARERGFVGPFPQLCDPEIGLERGCDYLADRFKVAAGDVSKALELWNGGADKGYATRVLGRAVKYGYTDA